MSLRKNFRQHCGMGKDFAVHLKRFVFFDKKTGAEQFEVRATSDGGMPLDRAANL
jgi:hypothetical protein